MLVSTASIRENSHLGVKADQLKHPLVYASGFQKYRIWNRKFNSAFVACVAFLTCETLTSA